MKTLHPASYFLTGYATAMIVVLLFCVLLSSCGTPPPDDFDRQLEAAIATMFNPDGSPRQ